MLEATAGIGNGISSRNSEVIHAGLYNAPTSLKARLCVAGRRLLYPYCGFGDRCLRRVVVADGVGNRAKHAAHSDGGMLQGLKPVAQCGRAVPVCEGPWIEATALFSLGECPVHPGNVPAQPPRGVQPSVCLVRADSVLCLGSRGMQQRGDLVGEHADGGSGGIGSDLRRECQVHRDTDGRTDQRLDDTVAGHGLLTADGETSIALIGTSTRCGPSRRTCPMTMESPTSRPRLHQLIPTSMENATRKQNADNDADDALHPCGENVEQRRFGHEERGERGDDRHRIGEQHIGDRIGGDGSSVRRSARRAAPRHRWRTLTCVSR